MFTFALLFFVAKYSHDWALQSKGIRPNFSLDNVFLFHTIFSLVVCISFAVMATKSKWFDQLGFIYLVVLVVKIAVFYGVFFRSIFSSGAIAKADSISLLIPMGIFLTAEVYFISKILNSK